MSRDDERPDERERQAGDGGGREVPPGRSDAAGAPGGEAGGPAARLPRPRPPETDPGGPRLDPPLRDSLEPREQRVGGATPAAIPPPPPAEAAERGGPLPRPRPPWDDEELAPAGTGAAPGAFTGGAGERSPLPAPSAAPSPEPRLPPARPRLDDLDRTDIPAGARTSVAPHLPSTPADLEQDRPPAEPGSAPDPPFAGAGVGQPRRPAPRSADDADATLAAATPHPPLVPVPRPRCDDDETAIPWEERTPSPRPRRPEEAEFAPSAETGAPPPPAAAATAAPAGPPPPTPLPDDTFFADLASGTHADRDDEAERSYRDLVRQVDAYREQGYELFGMVGYPKSGKTHALKALVHRLHGFDPTAREQFRRERAPGPTEAWPFYYAYTGSAGERWVFMDPGGELFARLRSNDWSHAEASTGLLHTIAHCKGLLLLLHLARGHLDRDAAGFVAGMAEDEAERERAAQKAQEEIEFFDQLLLFARALAAEPGGLPKLVRRAAEVGLDEALRPYRKAPPLEVPVAVLFTQADRLAEGRDFALGGGRYLAPQGGLVGVAPFVARNLPSLFTSVASHARRFRFDFVQSYVERPAPGGGVPLWSYGEEPLSVGLLPAIEFLRRAAPGGGLGRRAIDTRAALRLDRLLHPGRWRGVEIEL